MKRIFSLLIAILMLLCCCSFVGCVNSGEKASDVLRICNCEDYIDEDLLVEFTEQTGIEVQYSTYGTNENLYNELVINPNSYDLVVPSEYMIQKLASEGRINKLDLSKVPNYVENVSEYINSRLNGIKFTVEDGEYKGKEVVLSEYLVGYMWGTMGWVYNTDNVSIEDVKSWSGVFKNQSLSKKATIKDAVRDSYLVGLAMVYEDELKNATDNQTITSILNRVDQQSIDKVGQKLQSLKPFLYGFEVDSGKNDIVLGNIDAYVAWSGDAAYAIDVAAREVEDEDGELIEEENIRNLSYYIPDEGSNIWFDGFCMPTGSTNFEAVYKFLNFISDPENVYRNMNYTGYTGMVAGDYIFDEAVIGWFDESEDQDPQTTYIDVDLSYFFGDGKEYVVTVSEEGYGRLIAQYPTLEIAKRCAVMEFFPNDTLMSINDMWETVKGETFSVWLIILIVGFVILLGVAIVIYRNKDKIKVHKFHHNTLTRMEKKGYKIIKIEEIK